MFFVFRFYILWFVSDWFCALNQSDLNHQNIQKVKKQLQNHKKITIKPL